MTNPKLARDYLSRSQKRLKAIELLLREEAFAVTPSTFYTRDDAEAAKAMAEEVLAGVTPWIR